MSQGSGVRCQVSVFRPLVSAVLLFAQAALAQDRLFTAGSVPEGSVPPEALQKKADGQQEEELLRDPFWPIGFYPEGWQSQTEARGEVDMEGSGWKAAMGKIRVSGASRLGDRTAAIVNGELKIAGDLIEVLYEGKTYQWQIVGIGADGQIQLKKQGIR